MIGEAVKLAKTTVNAGKSVNRGIKKYNAPKSSPTAKPYRKAKVAK